MSLCLTSVLLWLLSGPSEVVLAQAGSGIIRVAPPPAGNDAPNCGGETNPCRTVQHVVDLAQSGSEILIASSTHTGVRAREGMLPPILGPLSEMGKYPRPDTITIIVRDDVTGDYETLTLTELGNNVGVFRNVVGLLPSTSGMLTPNNGELETGAGHTIVALYTDDDPSDTSSDDARMTGTGASDTDFTDSGGTEVAAYIIGVDGIYVTVQDGDENTNSSVGDTVSVLVTDSGTGDSETLTLTETGPNTGVFRNTVGLSSSSGVGSSDDGTLNTAVGNTIAVEYTDNDDPSDTSSDTATVVNPPIYLPVVLRQYPQGER